MTTEQIIATILSPAFGSAVTSLVRKLWPAVDGAFVWGLVLALTIGGNVLGYYANRLPPVVWLIVAPIVGTVLVVGGVQTAQQIAEKAKP